MNNNLNVKFTGIPFYIIYRILPVSIIYVLCLAYSFFTHRPGDYDLMLDPKFSIMVFFPLYVLATVFSLRYIGRSYSVVGNVFTVKSFSKILVKTELDDISEISEYRYKFDAPAFTAHFKAAKENEFFAVPVDCLLYKDSKRLYDILIKKRGRP